jgi:hypothetical protein
MTLPLSIVRGGACRTLLALMALSISFVQLHAAPASTNQLTEECAAFGKAFARLVPRGQMTVNDAFDVETLTDRTSKLLQGKRITREKLRPGLQAALGKSLTLLQGADLQFLRMREENGERRAVIRVIGRDHSLNYIELVCEARAMKTIKAVDIYTMTAGEMLSESMQRIVTMIGPDPSVFDRLLGKKDTAETRAKAMVQIVKLSEAGDHKGVLKLFNELPPDLQRQKSFIILRTQSAFKVSEEEYLAALRFWRASYPKDPSVDLVSIDAFLLQKKYDLALEAIDRLDAAVGGDPHLDSFRAVMHQKMGRDDLAREELKRAVAARQTSAAEENERSVRGSEILGQYEPPPLVPPSVRAAARTNAARLQAPAAKNNSMRLQGVFMRTGQPTAIIGGQNVIEGDSLDGNQVVKIESSRVVLRNDKGEMFSLTFQ